MTLPLEENRLKNFDDRRRVRILLAEDEGSVQMVVRRRLIANGYDVILANDGEEALNLAEQETPDLIVMDIMMPKMNGDIVAGKLQSNRRTSGIPVIFLTCLVQPDEVFVPQRGVTTNLILAKPLDSDQLLFVIEKLLTPKDPNS